MERGLRMFGAILLLALGGLAPAAFAEGVATTSPPALTPTTTAPTTGPATASTPAVSPGTAFDRLFAVNGPAHEAGPGPAGRVVERFAPPVAAPIDTSTPAQPFTTARGSLLRPCDTPGSGCRNPSPSTTGAGVPPIGPGTRPPTAP